MYVRIDRAIDGLLTRKELMTIVMIRESPRETNMSRDELI